MHLDRLDHLVYATPNLDHTVETLTALLGVRPSAGGAHPGRGTRNALLALGATSYLEIVGPDPAQPYHATPRWFDIDRLQAPRLVTWAAKGTRLAELREGAGQHGVLLGAVAAGRRQRPDGVTLAWELTDPTPLVGDGLIPFFIDWGASPHPAAQAAAGVSLLNVRAEHPSPDSIAASLLALDDGWGLMVTAGPTPALIATFDTPLGRVELR